MSGVHFRLDPTIRGKVQRICSEKGCSESDFYRDSVLKNLKEEGDGNRAIERPSAQPRPITEAHRMSSAVPVEKKYHSGYCRGYHLDPETGLKILSRPVRVATDAEIKELTI
jgi:hypothetical protein